ncbi:protein DMP9-like [Macadamia integrifolia]|uniref:protein DMP9-like n=1 Tax=Macadamia integrifolia TaxID=60698 RepID=UPI001C4E7C3E|nr:protein DMP9-like [Macadamia integrifolia]
MDSHTDAGGLTTFLNPPQDQIVQAAASQYQSQSFLPGNTTPPPHPPSQLNINQTQIPMPPEQLQLGVAENVLKQQHLMAMGVQKTLSRTSILVNFLPTGTLLAFEMLLPSVSGNGKCNEVSTFLIGSILALCAITCCFFHFTDSVRQGEKVVYGFVTFKGLLVYTSDAGLDFIKEPIRLKAGFTDFLHAVMSAMVFVAIAFSDHRVTSCLFPSHVKAMDEIMQTFPIMVGIVCSGLFLIFPTTRYGIGCMPS